MRFKCVPMAPSAVLNLTGNRCETFCATSEDTAPAQHQDLHQPTKFQQNPSELFTIEHIFPARFSNGEIIATFLRNVRTKLYQILTEHRTIVGTPEIVLYFTYIAPFLNAGNSKGTDVGFSSLQENLQGILERICTGRVLFLLSKQQGRGTEQ